MDLWAEIATVTVATASLIGTGIWKLGIVQTNLLSKIEEFKDEVEKSIDDERDKVALEFSTMRREVGEVVTAVRQKINEVELWSRDNFVRSDTFIQVVSEIKSSIEKMGDKIEDRINKVDVKLDNIIK